MGGENVTQTIESEVHQCTALKKNLSEELEKLTKLQKEVKVFRQHLSEVISRTKNAVVSSIDNYQRFINSPSKSLLILQRPKLMKLSKL
jgi:regulator of replication initiation timing